MKKLPIGLSSFERIMTDNYVYVDKTRHIYNLVNTGGGRYFLSRPRRFGKSLLIDTIRLAFEGREGLFKGLYLEQNWDWQITYPVLNFSFGEGSVSTPQALDEKISGFLDAYYEQYRIGNAYSEVSARFSYLIRHLASRFNKVVILIDEYDKPILDNIADSDNAIAMRERLRNFYSVIKSQDINVQFAMLTGVSKFSKVSLFSDLNNLEDLSLDVRYADICGYNQAELDLSFKKYLDNGQVDYTLLKKWYNGYNFAGSEMQKVYNPFDVLLFIAKGCRYQNYWFETATPTFLVKAIQQHRYFIPDLENLVVGESMLTKFDINTMPVATLLFQTGYLTIKEITMRGKRTAYRLGYPNYEVRCSLNEVLAGVGTTQDSKDSVIDGLITALEGNDFKLLEEVITSHFASIPNDWYRNNNIDQYEGFYASIVYSYFVALGYDLIAEDVTNHGRIDLTVLMPNKILIIEFKLIKFGGANKAISQIKDKGYPQKYLAQNKPIYLIGISFDPDKRNITELVFEQYDLEC
ncbi:ATP-binding protein [Facilibium subflavum]|uniref:ATP-binding protein n=1 Tax=Facilibium subflavum TaxID=2219058 RepID=UPI000E65B7DB|nr:ATP-binding protein [Facilibium subflavum]